MKVYVVGGSVNYANWMNASLVTSIEEADVVLITGGEDINPAIYGEKAGRHTYFNDNRDARELAAIDIAKELGKTIWGTCRGIQLLCAVAGGKLIQDMSHPSQHSLYFYDGSTCTTTSCHHQMQYPYDLVEGEDYYIIANSKGLSRYYKDGDNLDMDMPNLDANNVILEPELVYYPKLKALGAQGHPEWLDTDSRLCIISRALISLSLQDKLVDALDLNLDLNMIISRQENFQLSEDEQQLLKEIRTYAKSEATTGQSQNRKYTRFSTC